MRNMLLLLIIFLSFIGLGLPDALMGSAWPQMQENLRAPLEYAGYISMIIAMGTTVSSYLSPKIIERFNVAIITGVSTFVMAISIFGYSQSTSITQILLWSIPYGLGAGCVDCAINDYVANYYEGSVMNFLHAMWSVGAFIGPMIMGYTFGQGKLWSYGYFVVFILQLVLAIILLASMKLWDKGHTTTDEEETTICNNVLSISGVKSVILSHFMYCSLEQIVGLWMASYAVFKGFGLEEAAFIASLFFVGITSGRLISGVLTMKLTPNQIIFTGLTLLFFGVFGLLVSPYSVVLIGLGCAPLYPMMIYKVPKQFGKKYSQKIISYQVTAASVGVLLSPVLFGHLSNIVSISTLPIILIILLLILYYLQFSVKNITIDS